MLINCILKYSWLVHNLYKNLLGESQSSQETLTFLLLLDVRVPDVVVAVQVQVQTRNGGLKHWNTTTNKNTSKKGNYSSFKKNKSFKVQGTRFRILSLAIEQKCCIKVFSNNFLKGKKILEHKTGGMKKFFHDNWWHVPDKRGLAWT